jgi:hypothetical protein
VHYTDFHALYLLWRKTGAFVQAFSAYPAQADDQLFRSTIMTRKNHSPRIVSDVKPAQKLGRQLFGAGLAILTIGLGLFNSAHAQSTENCTQQQLLVSSWQNNNVKVFNACDGSYLRDLDNANRLSGPQAILQGSDGNIYVVSERNHRIIRYRGSDLSFMNVVVGNSAETGAAVIAPISSPTGAAFLDDTHMLVVNFDTQSAVVVDITGNDPAQTVLDGGSGLSRGPDVGIALDFQRNAYIPGFDNSSVVRVNYAGQGEPERIVRPGTSSLNAARSVLINQDQELLVASWRSNEILRFDLNTGEYLGVFSDQVRQPTHMIYRSADELLVSSDNSNYVKRIDARTGASRGNLVSSGAGGLNGATGMLLMQKSSEPVTQADQIWLGGLATIDQNQLSTNALRITQSGFFGQALDPNAVTRNNWGQLNIEFNSCNNASLSYQAEGPYFPAYGNGAYPIQRLARSPVSIECEAIGFENIDTNSWMSGVWYGGPSRDGEGFSIDVLENNQAIVTWYTYRARGD